MAITTHKFNEAEISKLRVTKLGNDWPTVYILENGEEMYIGETFNVSNRLKQHIQKPERKRLNKAHLITDERYNKSAALDIESLLIQYFVADDRYTLQNGNGGLSNHSYYDKEQYRAKFEVIWKELQEAGLAHRDLVQLRNTDLFKYSPYKALTEEQLNIADTIKDSLASGEEVTHIVNGEPGTGKSVLATFLVKYLSQLDETLEFDVALVIPQAGLRKTIKKVFSKIKGLKSSMVIGPQDVVGKSFDLLIVDEAHRLRRRVNLSGYVPFDSANKFYNLGNVGTQLDWIMLASKSQVLLYDGNQSVVPGDIRSSRISDLESRQYILTSQLRVMAGSDYIKYIDDLLTVKPTTKKDFGNYELKYFDSVSEMVATIQDRDREHGLARLVAGYAWTWETKKPNSRDYDIELDGLKLKWNSTSFDWVNSPNAINEVGCIHTVQGYDLNYVGVIIGPELTYDPRNHKMIVDKSKYMDFNGKRSIESPEELHEYIINIYKTLLSRGIKGTYVHAVNKHLAEYLKGYINS